MSLCVSAVGLRKKTVAPGASGFDTHHLRNHPGSADLFGPSDAVVKHILEVSGCVK